MIESRSFEHLIGLRLTEARHLLEEDLSCTSWPLQIIETAPPQAPQRPARAMPRKANHQMPQRAARPEKQFGEWRVLHCMMQNCTVQKAAAGQEQPGLQLLVAREELKPIVQNACAEPSLNL